MMQEVLHAYKKLLAGRDHPNLYLALKWLASVCEDIGKYEECESYLRASMEGCTRLYGEGHQLTIATMMNYAIFQVTLPA